MADSAAFEPVILYEDNHLLVVRKEPGMLAQEDHSGDPDLLSALKEFLRVRDSKPGQAWLGLVHRLDRPTGGVMVFAKTSKAASRLSESFRKQDVHKEYLALCEGQPGPIGESTVYEDTLAKDPRTNRSRRLRAGGTAERNEKKERAARLQFTVINTDLNAKCSLVRVRLITGRSHQIRVQFAERGFALVGDRKYGGRNDGFNQDIKLWAYRIDVPHPTTKEMLTFVDWPEGSVWKTYLSQQAKDLLSE